VSEDAASGAKKLPPKVATVQGLRERGLKRVAEDAASMKKFTKKIERNSLENVVKSPNVATRPTDDASTLTTRPAAAHDNKIVTMHLTTADPSEEYTIAFGGTKVGRPRSADNSAREEESSSKRQAYALNEKKQDDVLDNDDDDDSDNASESIEPFYV
jgi:hypothetical protein